MLIRNKRLHNTFKVFTLIVLTVCVFFGSTLVVAAPTADELIAYPEEATLYTATTPVTGVISSTEGIVVPAKKLNDIPVVFTEIDYSLFYTVEECEAYLVELADKVTYLEVEIASGDYTSEATTAMQTELTRINEIIDKVTADAARYSLWEQEYYYAAKTWEYLMQHGYSEVIAAAIIGNMMIETSGGTLALKPTIYSSGRGFYGLCQWSLYYRPNVADMPFEDQLDYLHNDMEREFKNFGFCYKRGFTFEDFLAMEDPAEAALAFAKVYERCGEGSYYARKKAAKVAFEYFNCEE